jgi:hypothetical protein
MFLQMNNKLGPVKNHLLAAPGKGAWMPLVHEAALQMA